MANLTANAAELTTYLKSDQKPHSTGTEAAINIAFIALTTFSHCLGVKVSLQSLLKLCEAHVVLAVRKD